jgi:hypothetical protein
MHRLETNPRGVLFKAKERQGSLTKTEQNKNLDAN